MKRKHR
jgi:hypothetical protein